MFNIPTFTALWIIHFFANKFDNVLFYYSEGDLPTVDYNAILTTLFFELRRGSVVPDDWRSGNGGIEPRVLTRRI